MRFTQQIIATFALLSICAYANPMSVGRNERDVSGLQIEWCGGMSDGECSLHCQVTFGQQAKHTCYSKYVNLKY